MIARTLAVVTFIILVVVGIPAIGYFAEQVEATNAIRRSVQ